MLGCGGLGRVGELVLLEGVWGSGQAEGPMGWLQGPMGAGTALGFAASPSRCPRSGIAHTEFSRVAQAIKAFFLMP